MATDAGLIGGDRDLAARVARLEQELADAKAALAQKPIIDRAQLFALTDSMFDRQITIIAYFLLSAWLLRMAAARVHRDG